MQKIVLEKPYRFVPPHRGGFWPRLFQRFRLYEPYLRKREGVERYECRHVERLRASLAAGYGILLAPNHCRTADPIVMGWLAKAAGTHLYAMASWHLFNQGRLFAWAIPRVGGFSVYREGVDRQAINLAIDILETAERPLVVFPEGAVSRTNDRLQALLDISPIARLGAKKRAKRAPDSKVVVHPVAIKYLFGGNLEQQADEVLTRIERRLTWRRQHRVPLLERVVRIGKALLGLKELEYLDRVEEGPLAERLPRLIDHLLQPLEVQWLGAMQTGAVVPRVKALRIKMLPDLVEGRLDETARHERWEQLGDLYLAHQLSCYPPDYLEEYPSVDRLLETVERFEEDLTDTVTVHGSLTVILEVGEAIDVSPDRDRQAETDPLMARLEASLQNMLDRLALESPLYRPTA